MNKIEELHYEEVKLRHNIGDAAKLHAAITAAISTEFVTWYWSIVHEGLKNPETLDKYPTPFDELYAYFITNIYKHDGQR